MKTYWINWRQTRYGSSAVKADSLEEARRKANIPEENFDWDESDIENDWVINDIQEIEGVA